MVIGIEFIDNGQAKYKSDPQMMHTLFRIHPFTLEPSDLVRRGIRKMHKLGI